jgi:hypothetical protein
MKPGILGSMCVELPKKAPALPYVAVLCALGWLSSGYAQEPHREIPPNAHSSAGEQGWACNNGFQQVSGLCIEEKNEVPSWGAFEVFVDGQWRCRPGYHREGDYCVPSTAPAHASYVGRGDHWECDWGFQKVASSCEEIKPPAHAYIEAAGHEWVCYPGFERKVDRCLSVSGGGPSEDSKPTP